MKNKDKIYLDLIEYWDNNPDEVGQIPESFKDKINEEELNKILRNMGNSLLFNYAQKIRQKIKEDLEIAFITTQKKQQKYQISALWASVFITLGLLVTAILSYQITSKQTIISERQLNLFDNQTLILTKQAEILEKTTAPYNPTLKWVELDKQDLAVHRMIRRNLQKEGIRMCIKNVGQTESGLIGLQWDNNWTYPYNYDIKNIVSSNVSCAWMYIVPYNCWDDESINITCNKDLIPIRDKWINLNLKIECNLCDPGEFNKTFRLCIWENSSGECT